MAGSAHDREIDTTAALQRLIRLDQLNALRDNVRASIPVNVIVSFVIALVAGHYGHAARAIPWFAAATTINLIRLAQCWLLPPHSLKTADPEELRRHWLRFCALALISGCIWSYLPMFCQFYVGPQGVFYLTVICGVTAGAVTYGTSHALMPSCLITPPLLTIIFCMLYVGGFEYDALAATALVYNFTLIRFALRSEAAFRETSRLKNEAVTLAGSLHEAHSQVLAVADQMTYRADHDGLTGLLNRTGFMQQAEESLADKKASFCLMLLDLDGFKSVNDVYGHHAGDRVLVEVARRLSQALTADFTVARLGGDEFAILYKTSDVDGIPAELATQLVTSIEVPFASFDVGRLGVCIGVCFGRGRNPTDLLTCADEALHAAKMAGRNQYYIFDEILRERSQMRRDVERDLPRALAENLVELWFQPIFRQKTRELFSLEGLLRWRHPRHGLIPPPDLLIVAAMAGQGETLLRYIFGQVCAMIVELRTLGLHHVHVAMNISPREISSLPIDEILLTGLHDLDLPASMLEIEITEESALDIRSVQDKLLNLSRSGVKITVDDFGVGYSSLATLRQPYISQIKIDYSFVRGVVNSPENQILVQAIFNLGRSLNVQVVAEGVENAQDLEWLEHSGGDLLQGYYLRPPTSKNATTNWLRQSHGMNLQSK